MQAVDGIIQPPVHREKSPGDRARPARRVLWVVFIVIGLAGCAGFGSAPPAPQYDSRDTQDLLTALYDANEGLESAKWLGKVSMTVDGTRRTFDRAAWAGAAPGRVRFDARTPFGLPVLTLACDEAYVTAVTHGNGQFYRKRVGSNSMGRILPVDISCQDFYRLLTGRPPLIDYHSARLENASEGMQSILLQRRFKGTVAKLSVNAASGAFEGFELLDIHGNRRYRARLTERRAVEGFLLPYRLHLENARGQLELEITRLDTNRPVDASLFQITPPK